MPFVTEDEQPEPLAREGEHIPPGFLSEAFHCPQCGVLTSQGWTRLQVSMAGTPIQPSMIWQDTCGNCRRVSFWLSPSGRAGEGVCVFPVLGGGPSPHVSMPEEVRHDYEEARAIVARSPRGACALLRLAAQKLVDDLESGGGDLNTKIGALVANGLPVQAQQALDALRVIGNEAVHPGELDLRDDVETATGLFSLLNFIVEDRIERPKKIAAMYAKLPPTKLQAIQQRDKPTA